MTSRRIASVTGAALAACALTLAGTTPAAAAPACSAGYVCSWAGTGFTGSRNLTPTPLQGCTLLGWGDISTRRSAVNPGPGAVRFARSVQSVGGQRVCVGSSRIVPPGGSVENFGFAAQGVAPA